jgi:hypothetical protein
MKPISKMTRTELAGFISLAFEKQGIDIVLSGGSCVSIYSKDKYVSMDLDFVNTGFTKRTRIKNVMNTLGFREHNRYFRHADTQLIVEFPPGPLGVGEEPVKEIKEIRTETGKLRIISPTDCVKDRLAWYYYDNDIECLKQAILVAKHQKIDLEEIERWSKVENNFKLFKEIRKKLVENRGIH